MSGRRWLVALLLATAGSAALATPAAARTKRKPKPVPAEREKEPDEAAPVADDEDVEDDEDEDEPRDRDDDRDDDDDDRAPDQGFQVDEGDIDREGDGDLENDGDDDAVQSEFEKDLFYVDKIDDRVTIDKTLVQGSFTSSSFVYKESGGALPGTAGTLGVTSGSPASRMFTDLRAQFAARHVSGGNWDVRLDGRVRYAANPADASTGANTLDDDVRAQSGGLGRNEADLRELSLARYGETTTFVLGRQLVPELAATRVDGVRLTVIRSERLSLLGFAGLMPVRGSRSIGFDYPLVEDAAGAAAGRLLPMGGGLGAAYRTLRTYGSFGAVVSVPGKDADPRAFVTSAGYFRGSPQLDVYHYAVIDIIGDAGAALTNLSLGVDYRPRPRVRLSANVNHVDTESLDIAARSLLSDRDAAGVVRNDIELKRVASNQARVGVSIALGQVEQIEVSTAISIRQRGEVALTDGTTTTTLLAAQSVEVWGQLVHRNLKGARVGLDLTKIAGIGDATFGRSSVLALRAFGSRDFKGGKGEAEVGLGYANASDDNIGTTCATVPECFGASEVSTVSLTGTVYYRLTPSVFGLVMLDVNRATNTLNDAGMATTDPAVLGLAGYLRLAYRY